MPGSRRARACCACFGGLLTVLSQHLTLRAATNYDGLPVRFVGKSIARDRGRDILQLRTHPGGFAIVVHSGH